jgi:geranylgeranylglycerol-phosphate geranylgeranyltransferase
MGRLTRIRTAVRIVRPWNLFVVAAGTTTGAVLSEGFIALRESTGVVVATSVAAILVAAGANAFNDLVDTKSDSVNRPDRPMPSGTVSRVAAGSVFWVSTLTALAISWSLSAAHVGVCAAIVAALLLYNLKLKHVALVGNVVVAVAVSMTLVFGAVGRSITVDVLVGSAFAFLTTLAREIVKDLQDQAGDAVVGSRSLPSLAGASVSRWLAAGIVAVTAGLVPMPFIWWGFSGLYLLIAGLAATCLLIVLTILARTPTTDQEMTARIYSRASTLLKASMVFGLAALLAARAPD